MPLIVQSTKNHHRSFNLSIINSQMQIATKRIATLVETKAAIAKMYQNGTTAKLSSQAQKAAHALAQYIYANKTSKKFAFVLGKDHQDQQSLLLTISSHPAKSQDDASLQKPINQSPTSTQNQEDPFLVKQLSWVSKALHEAEFGILFWIYQHRLSSQEALSGTKQVPTPITAVNFQRAKTAHEQLQDQAWTKMIAVIQKLTSRQLKISANTQQLPSQTKIDASHIMLAIQKIIISDDEISKAASKLMKATNIELKLVDKMGAIIITIKNYGHDKIMTIFGFKATGTPREVAQAKIDAAKDGANPPTKSNEVFHDKTPIATDVHAPTKHGVTFRFKSAPAINDRGESTFTYEVDVNPQVKGITLKDVAFVVSGFETKDQKDARERIAAQAKIDATQNQIGVTSPTRLNRVFHGNMPIVLDVNAPLKDGVTFKFKSATAINDKGASTLTYEVDASPQVEGTTPQDVTFVVSGFETKVQKDARERIAAQAKIDAAQNQIGVTSPTRLNQVFHGQTPTASHVIAPTKDGVTFKFKSATAINDKGASTLTYEVDANPQVEGTTPQDVTFVVSGFETKDQKDAREVIKKRLDTTMQNINDGALVIPKSITSTQFDEYVQAMGYALNAKGKYVMNKFAKQYRTKITSLTIPSLFTIIGTWFQHFNQITSLHISNSVTAIEDNAFVNSPLTTLSLGNQLQTIGANAFQSAELASLIIPNSVTTIGIKAFRFSFLTTLTLGDHLQTIGHSAFKDARLTSLRIPNSVTSIGFHAFTSSPLTTLSLGNQLQTIGHSAFYYAKLKILTIPDAVTAIGEVAFASSPLTNIIIFQDVTLGRDAFKGAKIVTQTPRPPKPPA